jgi:hypothetical protein
MMPFDADQVEKNARAAATPDLLDRVTVYREGMEPDALLIIEAELRQRGVSTAEVHAHAEEAWGEVLVDAKGIALRCSFCPAPAVSAHWGWHCAWGLVPVFPRSFRYCRVHEPAREENE